MASTTFDPQELNVPEIVESISGIVFAPVVLPLAAAVKQPTVQSLIKAGLVLSERCKEALAETGEVIENLAAEVDTELKDQPKEQFNLENIQTQIQNGFHNPPSEMARDFINVIADVNQDVGRITNGIFDLRLLLPVGLAGLAIRQLIAKGLQIDEIPWYTLSWYAFDSFIKLNQEDES